MKKMLTFLAAGLLLSTFGFAQKNQEQQLVWETIQQFGDLADQQNADGLDAILDTNFRIVMNQMFGFQDVMTINKRIYLQKIQDKEFGGEKREVVISDLAILGKTTNAKVSFKGSKMTFTSFIQLVQDSGGKWKLINDMPTVIW